MGGHGALISFLKNPNKYKSVSAFAPIANPSECEWGKFAFKGYLGDDQESWKQYDASWLLKSFTPKEPCTILIDQGTDDEFLKKKQLLPDNFLKAYDESGDKSNVTVNLRYQEGYDHSYYFMATFMENHIAHHAAQLRK